MSLRSAQWLRSGAVGLRRREGHWQTTCTGCLGPWWVWWCQEGTGTRKGRGQVCTGAGSCPTRSCLWGAPRLRRKCSPLGECSVRTKDSVRVTEKTLGEHSAHRGQSCEVRPRGCSGLSSGQAVGSRCLRGHSREHAAWDGEQSMQAYLYRSRLCVEGEQR